MEIILNVFFGILFHTLTSHIFCSIRKMRCELFVFLSFFCRQRFEYISLLGADQDINTNTSHDAMSQCRKCRTKIRFRLTYCPFLLVMRTSIDVFIGIFVVACVVKSEHSISFDKFIDLP